MIRLVLTFLLCLKAWGQNQQAPIEVTGEDDLLSTPIEQRLQTHQAGEVGQRIITQGESWEATLRELPGLQVIRDPHQGSLVLTLRGSRHQHVHVYLDHLLLASSYGPSIDLSTLPFDSIKQVHVYKEYVPLPYLAAPGGVIVFRTYRSQQVYKATAGSFYTKRLHASLQSQNVGIRIDGEKSRNNYPYLDNNGTTLNPDDDFIAKRQNAGRSHLSILPVARYQSFNGHHELVWSPTYMQLHRDLPAVTQSVQSQAELSQRLIGQQLQWNSSYGSFFHRFELEFQQFQTAFSDPLANYGQLPVDVTTRVQSLPLTSYGVWSISDQHYVSWRWRFNTDQVQELASIKERFRRRQHDFTLEWSYGTGPWSYAWQVGYQSYQDEGLVSGLDSGINSSAQVSYLFNNHTSLTLQASRRYHFPLLWQVQGNQGFLRSNSELHAEKFESVDLSFHWKYLELSLFQRSVSDALVLSYNAQGVGIVQNQDRVVMQGLEVGQGWQFRFPSFDAHSDLGVVGQRLSFTALNASTTTEGLAGKNQLPNVFQRVWQLSSWWNLPSYSWGSPSLTYRYHQASNLYFDDSNILPSRDLMVHSMDVSWTYKANRLAFTIENIFDRSYETMNGLPGPGKVWFLSYTALVN